MVKSQIQNYKSQITNPDYYRQEFGRLARLYDWATKFWFIPFGGEKRFRSLIVDLLEVEEGQNLLEVCCGTATLSLIAAERGAKITGVDLSPEMIDTARRKANARGFKARFIVANAEDIPLENNFFDRILISFGLHEMPKEAVENSLKEIYRLLKPGGIGLIVDLAMPSSLLTKALVGIFLRVVETENARKFVSYDLRLWLQNLSLEVKERILRGRGMVQVLKFGKL